jgi:hypothetical protein
VHGFLSWCTVLRGATEFDDLRRSSREAGNRWDGIDVTVPHSARIWNYWLGGEDHY